MNAHALPFVLTALMMCPGTPPAQQQAPSPQPFAFVENRGQWEAPVRFRADTGPMTLWITDRGWTFAIEEREQHAAPGPHPALRGEQPRGPTRGVAVRMTFEGAMPVATPRGEGRLPGVRNYFLGNDPIRWAAGVPEHAQVRYDDLYAGIDLVVREQDGHPEYDLHVARGADLGQVVVRCEGQDGLRLREDGALALDTALGSVHQTPPVAWHVLPDGSRQAVACRFTRLSDQHFGFAVADRLPDLPLVIDPGLVWSTYVGGGGVDSIAEYGDSGIVTSNGDVLICGSTKSLSFPTTTGAYQPAYGGVEDGFVTRLAPGGAPVWSTFLGGTDRDTVLGVDPVGTSDVLVTGWTQSRDFPINNAYDPSHNGMKDVFVTRLDWDGVQKIQTLAWSTFLGGSANDEGHGVVLHPTGAVAVLGQTLSANFPFTPGVLSPTLNGNQDCTVSLLSGNGSQLLASTYLGGQLFERAFEIEVDQAGELIVVGDTYSPRFPTTPNAYNTAPNGSSDVFVTRLPPSLTNTTWSTFLGGTNFDTGWSLELGPTGLVYVTGTTQSAGFPVTPGAFQPVFGGIGPQGYGDGYVSCLDPQATGPNQLVWSTFLGTSDDDILQGLDVERCGMVTVSGGTGSTAFPTTPGSLSQSLATGWDVVVTRFDPSKTGASQLVYSSYLGGSGIDWSTDVAIDAMGGAVVSGSTRSPLMLSAPWAGFAGGTDAFVAHLDMLPQGAVTYGPSTPACAWPVYQGVNSMPSLTNASFAAHVCGAPANALGAVFLGSRSIVPVPLFNLTLLIDPARQILVVPTAANALGHAELTIPLTGLPQPTQFALQWVFITTVSCPGTGAFSASNGLEIF